MNKKYHLWHYALLVLFSLIFIIVVLFIIPSVIFNDLVFGKYKGWNYNYKVFAKAFQFTFFFIGIKNKKYFEYNHEASKKYVFVTNHVSFFDIPEMLINIKQPLRILAKKGPDKVPVFGYYYKMSTVMVDRSSDNSRLKSMQLLKYYLDKGISILICPEGTFNMSDNPLKEFYDGAFRLAIETKTNIKPIIILDTFNTLHYSGFGIENGKSRVVYLQDVDVSQFTMEDVSILKNKVYQIMEDALIRYNAPWINPLILANGNP